MGTLARPALALKSGRARVPILQTIHGADFQQQWLVNVGSSPSSHLLVDDLSKSGIS